MRKIIIREDALLAIKDRSIFLLQEQREAGEMMVSGRKVKLFFIEIDTDVENYIQSHNINIDDVDQVSDFIISALTNQH
jgi:hypothetical protein